MSMRGVGVTQAALQVRSVAEVPDELRRVASGRAPCRRDSGEEISVGGDEGVGVCVCVCVCVLELSPASPVRMELSRRQ